MRDRGRERKNWGHREIRARVTKILNIKNLVAGKGTDIFFRGSEIHGFNRTMRVWKLRRSLEGGGKVFLVAFSPHARHV